jgi:hypothetical protein
MYCTYVITGGPFIFVCNVDISLLQNARHIILLSIYYFISRSQWPHILRRRSTAVCLLRSWVRIPPGKWVSVCCVCCVLSGTDLCDGLITRPEESYRLWRVVVCDEETSCDEETIARAGLQSQRK